MLRKWKRWGQVDHRTGKITDAINQAIRAANPDAHNAPVIRVTYRPGRRTVGPGKRLKRRVGDIGQIAGGGAVARRERTFPTKPVEDMTPQEKRQFRIPAVPEPPDWLKRQQEIKSTVGDLDAMASETLSEMETAR